MFQPNKCYEIIKSNNQVKKENLRIFVIFTDKERQSLHFGKRRSESYYTLILYTECLEI